MHTVEKSTQWSTMGRHLLKMIPMSHLGSSTWLHPFINNGVVKGGYKLHIPFNESDNPIAFADMIVEIYSLGVNFKICQNPLFINKHSGQKGKHLVLYPTSLAFLPQLSETSKAILMSPSDICVPNEERIANTRIFTRFCNYYDETFFNFDNWEFEVARRGDALPSFAKIPSMDLFDRSSFDKFEGKQLSDVLTVASKTYKVYQDAKDTDSCKKILDLYKTHFDNLWDHVLHGRVPICCINYSLLISLACLYGKIQG